MASTHPTTCSAGMRSSTKPEAGHRTGPASPMRQSTPARCAAKSCELTALTRASATAAVNTMVRSIVTNTCAPALVLLGSRTLLGGGGGGKEEILGVVSGCDLGESRDSLWPT
ncbi:Os07g0265350 [Oryza sativa Japonica Group]|uniref:Os07g0265350 protein n=1 Tax=Oryza sativa subsp. japonica TaxID=39947 RepID=A0A0P0X4C1_ORYSJ|nr:Os07g0265350 [Oryza sativa Japonica Group]